VKISRTILKLAAVALVLVALTLVLRHMADDGLPARDPSSREAPLDRSPQGARNMLEAASRNETPLNHVDARRHGSRRPTSVRGVHSSLFGTNDSKESEMLDEVQNCILAQTEAYQLLANDPLNSCDAFGLYGFVGFYVDRMAGVAPNRWGCICVCVVAGRTKHSFPSPARKMQLAARRFALAIQYEAACISHGPGSMQTHALCELLAEANAELGPDSLTPGLL
jgi:hypothetical protein